MEGQMFKVILSNGDPVMFKGKINDVFNELHGISIKGIQPVDTDSSKIGHAFLQISNLGHMGFEFSDKIKYQQQDISSLFSLSQAILRTVDEVKTLLDAIECGQEDSYEQINEETG